ncbi:MAG: tRNA lysidine(34) synthetase TilS [Anaerolineales bacterium]
MDLTRRIGDYVDREALLEPKQRLVVGVSGGADSLCLMDGLHRLGYRLVVAHFDHRLRPESGAEAETVREVAAAFGLPVVLGAMEAPGASRTSEQTARIERYRFLAQVARRRRIRTLAVGHTADDQVETVLMHLLRGAGPSGLRGMLPRTPLGAWIGAVEAPGLTVVRPLLELKRSQTAAYCAARGMSPLQDPSNQDLRFFRNRLRHELIPQLRGYSPGIEDTLLRTAKLMAAETELVDELVESSWSSWVREFGSDALRLDRDRLVAAPVALQRAALRRAIQTLRPELRDIGFEAIERGLRGLRDRRRQTLIGQLELLPVRDDLILKSVAAPLSFPDLPQLRTASVRRLRIPGSVSLANHWGIELRSVRRSRRGVRHAGQVRFDLDRLPDPLVLRPPRPADRLQPIGMRGTLKVADLFINRKIPRQARARWPVLASGEDLIWIPGLHRSRIAAPSSKSRRLLELSLRRPAG